MSDPLLNRLSKLDRVIKESNTLLANTKKNAKSTSLESSEVVFATFGGLALAGLTVLLAPPALPLLVPLMGMLGTSGAVMLYRGRPTFLVERKIKVLRLPADDVLRRIEALPPGTPKNVRDALWSQYLALMTASTEAMTAKIGLPAPTSTLEVSFGPPVLNPPATMASASLPAPGNANLLQITPPNAAETIAQKRREDALNQGEGA